LQQAKTRYENAKTLYQNLKRNFSSGWQSVGAPISGYLRQLSVRNGDFVHAGQTMVVVSQNRDLFVKAEVQPKYYAMLSEITSATFRNPATGASYSLEELGGQLVSYGKSVDLQHPLIPVLFQINNTKDWIPGAFVELYIRTQGSQPVITVPRKAILEEMGNHFVYVQLTPEYYEKRQVNIGRTDGARTEILSGLNGSERVVVNGATNVRRVRSASMFGFSFVWAEFNWGMDVFKARQIVSEKMVALSGTLPKGIMPQLAPQSSIMGEILLIGMQADSTSMMDLRTLADWVIKPAILATGGVSQVTSAAITSST
jgi:hypothetical protein